MFFGALCDIVYTHHIQTDRPTHQIHVRVVDGEGEGVQGDKGPAEVDERLLPAPPRAVGVGVEEHARAGVHGDEEELRGCGVWV